MVTTAQVVDTRTSNLDDLGSNLTVAFSTSK